MQKRMHKAAVRNGAGVKTPIVDFVTNYVDSGPVRFHMPGHKGQNVLGCEARDITEISGADALYEASGVIAESEAVATELFGTGRTVYSTEGSSQCVRAMLELAVRWWRQEQKQKQRHGAEEWDDGTERMPGAKKGSTVRPMVVAARNVHKAFMYAAVLLDFDILWLWPEEENASLCSCMVTADTLENVLEEHKNRVAAVYLTSPNYLGGEAEVSVLSKVCHKHGTLLCVDNAHGAYLHFLEESRHPMDLGADLCCDSAHKTLPVLTGGAYLHISKTAPEGLAEQAKAAMELFGSTSPSYLILQSLDLCNAYLADGYRERLAAVGEQLEETRKQLRQAGWQAESTDPLRLTIKASAGRSGYELAERLRTQNIECEYADEDYLVLMATPENEADDFQRLLAALGNNQELSHAVPEAKKIPVVNRENIKAVCPVREAYFSQGEVLPVKEALGRICRVPTAACPPAIPIVVPGERIDETAVQSFLYYGIETIEVIKE